MGMRHRAWLPAALYLATPLLAAQASVLATVETAPVASSGDAADDPVVWVHPVNPALSTVIGTDKQSGIGVYDLAGNLLQFLPDGNLNNVDLRQGFPLGGASVALVTSAERNADVLAIYRVDPLTRQLRDVAARVISLGMDAYGCCMYRSPLTDRTYFFVTSEDGDVQQWRLFDAGNGRVDAVLVRAFVVGDTCEGCVADDENGSFFVSEEEMGIWRYGAEPGSGTARVLVDGTGSGGHLQADVEGLAIYYAAGGAGYLIASSQGSNTYNVYARAAPHAFLLDFQVAANTALGIDGTSDTDGIDVMNLGLGSAFPGGVFVVQDGSNPGANQNFKLIPWPSIASAATPPLIVDASYALEGLRRPGRACKEAEASYRFGSGVNPFVLTSRSSPRLGTLLEWDLDCAGHAPGMAYLSAYARPVAGVFGPWGESLVDPASQRYFLLSKPHSGNKVRFGAFMPLDPDLCGLRVHLQGLFTGAPGTKLTNAIELHLGF
jgi:3-phytase